MLKNAVIVLTSACALIACESETPLPSPVETIMVEKCQQCHGETLEFGAPMRLHTWEDTQASAVTNSSLKVWELMQLRIHDTGQPMPPRGVPALEGFEIAILDSWFAEGAPAAEQEE